MKLIIFVNILFALFSGINELKQNKKALVFENYYNQSIWFPNKFIKLHNTSSILTDLSLLRNVKMKQEVHSSIFNKISELDMINKWTGVEELGINPYSNNYQEFLKQRKKEIVIYDYGLIRISDKFDSHLILVVDGKTKRDYENKSLYIVNVANNKLKSLTKVAQYFYADGTGEHIYSEKNTDNIFSLKGKLVCSDNIDADEKLAKEIYEKETSFCKYKYDQKGYLRILKD
jgi:hypothetical protein